VSLRQVDPVALIALRATRTCAVELPEELFDLDALATTSAGCGRWRSPSPV
jgi:hypothetical protein